MISKWGTNTMANLQELKEFIAQCERNGVPLETPVMFTYNYGDYWRTDVCLDINLNGTEADTARAETSSYHGMMRMAEEGEEWEDYIAPAKDSQVDAIIFSGNSETYHKLS